MKNSFLLAFVLFLLSLDGQGQTNNFQSLIKANFQKTASKQITAISLKNSSGGIKPDSSKHDTLKYVGEFPIESIKLMEKKEVTDFMAFLSDSLNFISGTVTKSCAFVPSNVFIFQKNKLQIIAYSYGCNQIAVITADLKKIEAIANLSKRGQDALMKIISKK